ncbi:MAG: DUF115 domain-containing protein [Lachnospiraceae bacterium]|nr:DUF115 domain-containing protein [Lachnospiraceae bacterium]
MTQLVEDVNDFVKINEYANRLVYSFRRQYFYTGWNHQKVMIGLLQDNLDKMVKYAGEDIVAQLGIAMFLEACEHGDEILVADVVEGSLIPTIESLIQSLEYEVAPEEFDYYERNLEALRRNGMSDLIEVIEAAEPRSGKVYSLEYTSSGYLTIKVNDANGSYYLSGNNNPMRDAYSYVAGNIEDAYYRYTILGAGLFFEAKAIIDCRPDVELEIIEEDAYLLKLAMHFSDVVDLLDGGQVRIKHQSYTDYITGCVDDTDYNDRKILVRKPSVKHMTDSATQEVFSRFFMNIMSRDEQRRFLDRNYRLNVERGHNLKSADECRDLFEGKRAYLIAGGPSLDLVMKELTDRPRDSVIICAGTSAAKLMKNNIVPDVVIITDMSYNMYKQIHGKLDEKRTKLFYMSTANFKAVADFNGDKYLICQKGMPVAEEYATEHGYTVFETGGSVSTTALDVCLRFKCSEIVCMGLDLAFTDNKTHASDTLDDSSITNDGYMTYEVRGVRGDSLRTSENLRSYHVWIERRIENEKKIKMINISNGAYIQGMDNKAID